MSSFSEFSSRTEATGGNVPSATTFSSWVRKTEAGGAAVVADSGGEAVVSVAGGREVVSVAGERVVIAEAGGRWWWFQ